MQSLILLALALSAGVVHADDTMRCGSQLISTGDRAFEVESKCGAPAFRDVVGYTLGPYERREMKIEEWVYGPNNGVNSILTFEGSRLLRIERKRQ
ncbi:MULTISPECIES: DUF2845 domain-containing protein [Pseudomonas]|uniref:DUF2845 domain-containing protein n=1 Tax=Pseudomonas segetis TaxID=298908 RepID=A0A239GNX1_9PSED|nr:MULTISPECIES: DUF2845 domain-containing protein [Pseudomonas]SNS70565.1 Protein of unknown function [Pseudomonas segetis]